MANSLARSSSERVPSPARGSLNTPDSNRLYQSTNPSWSHSKIFSRSPRRERKTKRWPLRGSWPMTARTRSASRSNPQRMSVASAANQMRAACAWSSVRKRGSPIMTPTPPQPVRPANDSRQSLAQPPDSARCWAAPQSLIPALSMNPSDSGVVLQLVLPRTAVPLLLAAVCSSSKTAMYAVPARDKMRPHSARFLAALKPDSATLPVLALWVGSSQKLAASNSRRQDGVQISLTINPDRIALDLRWIGARFQGRRFNIPCPLVPRCPLRGDTSSIWHNRMKINFCVLFDYCPCRCAGRCLRCCCESVSHRLPVRFFFARPWSARPIKIVCVSVRKGFIRCGGPVFRHISCGVRHDLRQSLRHDCSMNQ